MPNGGWMDLTHPEGLALLLALAIAACVVLGLRFAVGVRWIPALAFAPVPAVAAFSSQFNLVGWHGFMHAAPIYQFIEGGAAPPEEPLFAGGTLRYPWVEHWLIAQLSRLTGANAHVLTLLLEVAAYAALLAAAYWLASALTDDPGAIGLAVLFSGFGISIFHVGLLSEPFARAFPNLWLETRVVPLDKFANLSAMPVGYACMGIAAAAGVRLAAGKGEPRRLAGIIAAVTFTAALMHPLSWLCILPFQGVVGAVLLWARNREDYRRLAWLAVAVVVPCGLALPYLRSVGASESSDGWSGFTRGAELFWAKAGDAAVFIAPLVLLLYVQRARLKRMLSDGNRALCIVLLALPTFVALYLLLRFPGRNEYKFLLSLVLAGAPLMGLCVRALLERHLLVAALLLVLLLSPGARALSVRPSFEVTKPCRMDGPYLRALEPNADALYQWIARETPKNAVFVAADLAIPSLGRRVLYVPVDDVWRGRDGWGLEPFKLRQWHVRWPDAVMAHRHELAREVLSLSWNHPAPAVIAEIQSDVPGRPLFTFTRTPAVIAKLDQTPGAVARFRNPAGAVYEFARARAAVAQMEAVDHD